MVGTFPSWLSFTPESPVLAHGKHSQHPLFQATLGPHTAGLPRMHPKAARQPPLPSASPAWESVLCGSTLRISWSYSIEDSPQTLAGSQLQQHPRRNLPDNFPPSIPFTLFKSSGRKRVPKPWDRSSHISFANSKSKNLALNFSSVISWHLSEPSLPISYYRFVSR